MDIFVPYYGYRETMEVRAMNIDEMRKRRKELGLSYQKLAEMSGVPLGTVQKVFGGVTESPRYSTILALENILAAEPAEVRESTAPYSAKKQGEYTVEDYLAWPEDQRIELIDGVIYDMAAPNYVHQIIAGEIYYQLKDYVRHNGGNCTPFISPADVQLDNDDKTMIQPDVFIICDREKFDMARGHGAPDFVVEILSKSTRKKDMQLKLSKYEAAGVREYWIVDPDRQKIIVYSFGDTYDIEVYAFDQQVPVGIYDGQCKIDLSYIIDQIKDLSK